ncbi:hypothetical protein QEG_1569, partial [Clostridioides difficile CD127]
MPNIETSVFFTFEMIKIYLISYKKRVSNEFFSSLDTL